MDPAQRTQPRGDEARGREALAAVEAAWNRGAAPWTAAAIAAVYTPDAVFFGGRPGHFVGGRAIHDYFASYDGVIESGSMRLVDQHVVALAPEIFLAQGFVDFSFVLAGAKRTASRLRTTLVLVRQQGEWKIKQHHFSSEPATPPLGDDEAAR